jgi:dienelactone hydrolase
MGLITEHDGLADGYQAVLLPPDPVINGEHTTVFRRSSARPSRRAVLYLHCLNDSAVPRDLATWYTERGFHFYLADLHPQLQLDQPPRGRRRHKQLRDCFAGIDAACAYLREADGIDALIVSGHGTGALAAALWCDARRTAGPADALVLSAPAFGRRLRHGLEITCPVLVFSAAGDAARPAKADRRGRADPQRADPQVAGEQKRAPGQEVKAGLQAEAGEGGKPARRRDRRAVQDHIWLGPHVTWLRLDDGLAGELAAGEDRRRFFDEVGRWLGAYMYGQVRDQLL